MALFAGGKPEVARYRYYSEVQKELRTGDYLCWRVNKIRSGFTFILFLYQKLFKATYSHVAIVLRLGDRLFAVEATYPRVRLIPLHMLNNFYVYKLGIEERRQNEDILLRHIGKKYSFFDLLKNMLSLSTNTDELYCSELALDFLETIGYFDASTDEFGDEVSTPDAVTRMVIERSKAVAEFVKIDKGNIDHGT